MTSMVDWFARLIMLVLASFATLAMIGSFVSMTNQPLGDAFPGSIAMRDPAPVPSATASPVDDRRGGEPGKVAAAAGGEQDRPVAVPQTLERETEEVTRWLKALTYAVLALAGFVAAGVIALARIARHLGRVADR